ncbi:MAG: hypothetical protein Q8941_01385 [Bacteroidota bacterium]|nr:hypothetical protein [Bacteroidota bacterium]
MKLSVITNQSGEILGTFKGHAKDFQYGDFKASIVVSKDQKHHEIEVPDEFEHLGAEELHKNVAAHLKKSK